jgi:hypothetical protein
MRDKRSPEAPVSIKHAGVGGIQLLQQAIKVDAC